MTQTPKLVVHTKPTGNLGHNVNQNRKPQKSRNMEEEPLYPVGAVEEKEKPTTHCQLREDWENVEFLAPSEINAAVSKGGNEDEDNDEQPLLPIIE